MIFLQYFKKDSQRLIKEGVCFKIAGQFSQKLSKAVRRAAKKLEENSRHNQGNSTVILCFEYGGRSEIVDMVKKVIALGIKSEEIDEDLIKKNLYQSDVPALDLIIRTSGEQRLSGFQLWRSAYAELMFVDKFWPDFTKVDLRQVIADYYNQCRFY